MITVKAMKTNKLVIMICFIILDPQLSELTFVVMNAPAHNQHGVLVYPVPRVSSLTHHAVPELKLPQAD